MTNPTPDPRPSAEALREGETLCGTCRWWDHATLLRHGKTKMSNRIAACLWGKDMALPEWCDGLRGYYYTNEAGTTANGCATWERRE